MRSYGGKDQTIEGVVLKEAVIRATSDLTDLNGLGRSYVEYRMENGDKIFARGYFLNHKLQGSDRLKNLTELDITGGTGKFRGIRGIVRAETVADSKSFNQNRTEFEYWFEK
ncbi:dirigent protein [Ralstonia pseudosolanacearum]|uniref:dirigent protein n=1 Tax=Ralstonia pseudosolanacearum TaxID=1310165 RepID=UPI002004EDAC|nr:dirigent protein [Ralstonia pseudosolanacearum]MCK4165600.1 dirigent protein [Ralstonia pseudosolanacearum]